MIRFLKGKTSRILMLVLVACIGNTFHLLAQSKQWTDQVVPTNFNVQQLAQYQAANPQTPTTPSIGNQLAKSVPNEFPIPTGANIVVNQVANAPLQSVTPSLSSTPSTNFLALEDNNTTIPPINGAVGLNHVMTTLNSEVRIQNKTGGIVSTVSLNAFCGVGSGSFDPKVLYDPYQNRWMVTACLNAASSASSILVAVSQTSDPTGTWNRFVLDVDASNTNWFDFPSIGFNKDWIVVSGNMFSVGLNSFAGTQTYVFNKANLYANTTTTPSLFVGTPDQGFTFVPSIHWTCLVEYCS